ncbi:MAG: hypothetical protein PHY44_06195 [Lachnospiraceae bacterium]|nr:hypothetical protein [Lachnospiraceae bacterium]
MYKKFLSVTLAFTMTLSMGISTYAADTSINQATIEQATIVVDNCDERIATCDDVVATYDKKNNVMYVNDGINSFSYSLDGQENNLLTSKRSTAKRNTVIKSEAVALHSYEWVRTTSGDYYWGVDIP